MIFQKGIETQNILRPEARKEAIRARRIYWKCTLKDMRKLTHNHTGTIFTYDVF